MAAQVDFSINLNDEQFKKILDKTRRGIENLGKQTGSVDSRLQKAGESVKAFANSIKGMAAAAGIGMTLKNIVDTSIGFEKSLSTLKSIIGATTEEMQFFKQEAIRLGSTTTQTASQVTEAFQLIGGQQPELLKNKTALVEVTEAAIVLAEAAQIDVPSAAKALSGSLNQMGESSTKATDYINILAAASQEGAAEIPYLNTAIEKSGGTASSVGVKFNELVAAIEAIAPKITQAEEAGTGLRNVFLNLEKSTDRNIKPSVVGLTESLENLAKKQLNVTQLTAMFGRGNVTAALALINSREEYKRLTEAITGTNKAYEQQEINNDNVAGSIAGLKSSFEGLVLTINNSNGAIKKVIDSLTEMTKLATNMFKSDEVKLGEQITKETKIITKEIDKQIAAYEKRGWSLEDSQSKMIENYVKESSRLTINTVDAEKKLDDLRKKRTAFGVGTGIQAVISPVTAIKSEFDLRNINKEISVQEQLIRDYKSRNEAIKTGIKYIKEYNSEVVKTETVEGGGNGQTDKIIYQPGSLGKLDEEIKAFQTKLTAATDEATRTGIRKAIADLQKEKHRIDLEATLGISNLEEIQANVSSVLGNVAKRSAGGDIEAGKINVNSDFEGVFQLVQSYNNEQRRAIELQKAWAEGIGTTASGFQSLSTALSQVAGENEAAARTAKAFMMVSQGLAAAQAIYEGVKTGFPAMLFAIPSALAAVVSAFAVAGSFEEGGIVPGHSFTGDRLTARVNSGEMILNRSQQSRLFDVLSAGGAFASGEGAQEIKWKIKGSDLEGALINHRKKRSKF